MLRKKFSIDNHNVYSKTHVAAREHVCVAKAIYKGYRVFNEIVIKIQKIVSIV